MQVQLPLFLPYDQVRALPIFQKYEKIFSELGLSGISNFNRGIGANGNSQHALIRAFIMRSLESLNTVSALIRFLQANPALIYLCGFRLIQECFLSYEYGNKTRRMWVGI